MGSDWHADRPESSEWSASASAGADAAEAPSCMKWGQDGELSAVDLQGILSRLSAVDQQATQLMNCSLDG